MGESTDNTDAPQALREELEAQIAITAKAKKVAQLAQLEIDRLRSELRQSLDRETDIRAKGHKAVKVLEEKLGNEEKPHAAIKEEKGKLQEEFHKLEKINTGLGELLEKKKVWYEEQLTKERESLREEEARLRKDMSRMEELHSRESDIWSKMKSHYEEAVTINKRKIENLKKALDDAQSRSQAITGNVPMLLQKNRERFMTQLKTALDKGWTTWAEQAVELHIYRADGENRQEEGCGFYKLNDESVADVRTELTWDY